MYNIYSEGMIIVDITNIVDVLIILIILLSGVNGYHRGVIKQVVSTVGLLLIIALAFYFKNPLAEFLSFNLPFFKFWGSFSGLTSLNIIFYQLISFMIIFSVLEVVLKFSIKISGLIEKILKYTIILGIPSKILGFVVGVVEGFIVVFVALFFLKQPAFHITQLENSKLADTILNSTPILSGISSDMVEAIDDVYKVIEKYQDEDRNNEKLNLETIDVMLKHKVITPDYVIKLVDIGKIKVDGIDKVLEKYE
ncbi:MAG: CvpA family protein [Firmicutes bacterium]|nr:CvpA family protein [Bacillota bacterium]